MSERRSVATEKLTSLLVNPWEAQYRSLRAEVRDFIDAETLAGNIVRRCDAWLSGWDEEFSRKLGRRGWIGITIPVEFGGHGRSALERYVVTEELLAAGAPVAAHWITDRQVVPSLLRYGTEFQKRRFLPIIAKGDCYFAIGLSEPDAGSDLAAVQTRAQRVHGGWLLTGTKLWTSGAHRAHALTVLARSGRRGEGNRHAGLTQFIVEIPSEGLSIRPIRLLTGEHHFNEVVFEDVFVRDELVLGGIGDGWAQVTSELAFERSGPERWLSTFPLFASLIDHLQDEPTCNSDVKQVTGVLATRIWVFRQMSMSIAAAIERGEVPNVPSAVVKDAGTRFEGELIEMIRQLRDFESYSDDDGIRSLFESAVTHSPGYTLRGGTNEVLRGVVARALGVS